METIVTLSLLPDLLAASALLTLAISHLMIYFGRRKDAEEVYNLYFSIFAFSVALFIVVYYLEPRYFLYSYKPSWINTINIEILTTGLLFFSSIKFLNTLLKLPASLSKYFYITFITIFFNCLLTLTSNFISKMFYFNHILIIILLVVVMNVFLCYFIYGFWIYKARLYKNNFILIIYFGFVFLTLNILIYRFIELSDYPKILIANHYFSALLLYIFAYALSVKFNKEHQELRDLKVSLEKKVEDRTNDLKQTNQLLENKNIEIEKQKQEIIEINSQLSFSAKELKELDIVKSRFFTDISHEFRTPLTLIIGPLETLISKTGKQELIAEYEIMLRQAKRLLVLINQLLELSKLQKGMLNLNVCRDNFNRFIHAIVSSYTSFAQELNIELSIIEEIQELQLWFDKDKLEKIITNLITNALKFTGSGGKIEVILRTCKSDNQFIEIIIRDTGIGIEPGELEHIFDPFYQSGFRQNSRIEGTGIGLALVKELLQLHRGTISVNSTLNKGSEFVVQLPVNKSAYHSGELFDYSHKYVIEPPEVKIKTSEKKTANEKSSGIDKEKTVLLIVEDNDDMRAYISSGLSMHYQIIEASNGKEGCEKATEIIPDLIIADVMMPVMNGLEMTRLLKNDEHTCHIPIIILTAKASEESLIEGLNTQADEYIAKPFNKNELTLKIRNLIAIRQKLRDKFSKGFVVYPSEIATTSMDERFLQKALQIVEKNRFEQELNATRFCTEIGMSRTQVHRKLKALTGQTTTEFIRTIRLKKAAQLLRQNAGSISEIAFQSGFNNLSYFTLKFKKLFGITPSEYLSK